jgi:hypothetical protein
MQIDEAKLEIFEPQRSLHERSQARIQYYKPKPEGYDIYNSHGSYRRPAHTSRQKHTKSWRERAVLQAIICGGFLAVLLFFNVVDSAFTNGVMGWVDRNLSYSLFTEDDGVGSWALRLVSIFQNGGGDAVEGDVPELNDTIPVDGPTSTVPSALPPALPSEELQMNGSWVDESILKEIEALP